MSVHQSTHMLQGEGCTRRLHEKLMIIDGTLDPFKEQLVPSRETTMPPLQATSSTKVALTDRLGARNVMSPAAQSWEFGPLCIRHGQLMMIRWLTGAMKGRRHSLHSCIIIVRNIGQPVCTKIGCWSKRPEQVPALSDYEAGSACGTASKTAKIFRTRRGTLQPDGTARLRKPRPEQRVSSRQILSRIAELGWRSRKDSTYQPSTAPSGNLVFVPWT
jgi:hypothetical protein